MNTKTISSQFARKLGITLAGVLALTILPAHANTFGTTGNEFTIDFVNIGNPGNANDSGTTGFYSGPYGGVAYEYRMGTARKEIPSS